MLPSNCSNVVTIASCCHGDDGDSVRSVMSEDRLVKQFVHLKKILGRNKKFIWFVVKKILTGYLLDFAVRLHKYYAII